MKKLTVVILLVSISLPGINSIDSRNDNRVLSRRKRFIVFPEGSTFSAAICLTAQTTLPEQLFTEAINWGISYELPNDSSEFREYFRPKHVLQRRHRRDLYQKMEVIMNSMGYDGRACILRALCETSRKLAPQGNGVVEALLHLVFRFPQQRLLKSEPEEHRLYHWAHRIGEDPTRRECAEIFPECSFSLIDMALGGYTNYLQDSSGYT